ncbi:hypothetical protein [Moraxella oculi]|nr:hypothetical protein [Moraxella sp. Tifton1]
MAPALQSLPEALADRQPVKPAASLWDRFLFTHQNQWVDDP